MLENVENLLTTTMPQHIGDLNTVTQLMHSNGIEEYPPQYAAHDNHSPYYGNFANETRNAGGEHQINQRSSMVGNEIVDCLDEIEDLQQPFITYNQSQVQNDVKHTDILYNQQVPGYPCQSSANNSNTNNNNNSTTINSIGIRRNAKEMSLSGLNQIHHAPPLTPPISASSPRNHSPFMIPNEQPRFTFVPPPTPSDHGSSHENSPYNSPQKVFPSLESAPYQANCNYPAHAYLSSSTMPGYQQTPNNYFLLH